jgi:hypothetical protein
MKKNASTLASTSGSTGRVFLLAHRPLPGADAPRDAGDSFSTMTDSGVQSAGMVEAAIRFRSGDTAGAGATSGAASASPLSRARSWSAASGSSSGANPTSTCGAGIDRVPPHFLHLARLPASLSGTL